MIYIAQLLDGCMDAGSTEITATTIESAIEQSEALTQKYVISLHSVS